jgi:hypothetical protein
MAGNLTFALYLIGPPLAGELILLFLLFRSGVGREGRTGGLRILAVNVVSVILLLGLMFAGGEIYYRYVYDTTDSLAYTKVTRQWVERYYVENAAGFRDNIQYSLSVEPGRRRISFLGDSFTAGHGIKSVEDRFPNILRREHPEWEVHVLARFGADTGAELLTLKKCVDDGYQFDQVVLVYCLNDVSDLMPEWTEALDRIREDEKRGGWLRQHSFFLDIIYHRLRAASDPKMKHYYDFVQDGYRGAAWEEQKKRLTLLRDLVQAHGGRLLVVTFPFLQSIGPDYKYQFIHDELNEMWSGLGVPCLDLLPVFTSWPADKLTVNRYDAHPDEFANAIAAERIGSFLQSNLVSHPR